MQMKDFSPNLKDSLVRLYNFIEKFKDTKEWCQFTVDGVNKASHHLTGSFVGKAYAERFIKELNLIKDLASNQPEHVYNVTYNMTGEDNVEFNNIVEYRIKTYDNEVADYHCKLNNRYCAKIEKVK